MPSSLVPRLAALCSEHLLREKILIAPSLAIGHQIADAVAQSGTPWVNLRIETARTLADAVAGFRIAAEGRTVLSRAQALAVVERACDEVLDESSYFAAIAGRSGLHRAVQRSIDDLRHAGVDSRSMPDLAFEDPRKAEDLRRILDAYGKELRERHFIDRFGVLALASEMLRGGAPRPWPVDTIWLLAADVELTGAEEGLIRLVAPDLETIGGGTGDRSVIFRKAIGEENELRGVFRSLVTTGPHFDEAEIAYTTRDPYLPLAYELASEYEVPCTFAEGIPVYFTRPGQACLSLIAWLGGGWQASELQAAATGGSLHLKGLSGAAFARILRGSVVGWGRARSATRLESYLAEQQKALEGEEDEVRRASLQRDVEQARVARDTMAALLAATVEIADGDEIDAPRAARATANLLEGFGAVRSELDGMAREALLRMLGELSVLPPASIARTEVATRLSDAVRGVHVSASNPRPGFLHVAPSRLAGWSGRSRLFVIGLDESRHPGSTIQDPVVLDAERAEINRTIDPHRLLLMADAPARSGEQFSRLLSRTAAASVTLSWSSLDLGDRRGRYPAPVVLDEFRRSTADDRATYAEVAAAAGVDGFVDPNPLSAPEWWLKRRFVDGETRLQDAVRAEYAGTREGNDAERARESDAITPFDGLVAADAALLDPRLTDKVYSASQLELMARCPFRYFVERQLGVRAIEELEYEPDRWLEAREFGSMLHEVLETTMLQLCEKKQKPSLLAQAEMETIAEEALTRWREAVPPPSDAAFERRRLELLGSCAVFLRTEEEPCRTVTPKFFEVSFGFGEEGEGTLAMPEPLILRLGSGKAVRLRGRIDRVDHDEARDEWFIWDYKSGSTWDYERGGALQRGTKVQHAIYARALEAMLARKRWSGKVVKSGYYFPTPKGRGARFVPGAAPGELEHALDALFDVVGTGFFPHADLDGCKWCDFEKICGGSTVAGQRMRMKLIANASDPAVAAWLRLQEIR